MDYLDNKTFKSCKINSLVKGRKKKEKMWVKEYDVYL